MTASRALSILVTPIAVLLDGATTQQPADPTFTAYRQTIPDSQVTFDLIPVPGGTFRMGSPADEKGRADHEGPPIEVTVSPFWMARCEVTWAEYDLWNTDASRPQSKKPDGLSRPTPPYMDMTFTMGRDGFPAICMSHVAARQYCAWLSQKTGRFYRLPTEAEWEYAARFPDGRRYPWGNELDLGRGHFARGEGSDTERVETYATGASALGLLNLAGNVWEWVLDWYDPEYYAVSPRQDPPGPAAGTERVARGGAYATDPQFVRTANRLGRDPNRGFDNVGFRCAVGEPPANAPRLPTVTPSPPAP